MVSCSYKPSAVTPGNSLPDTNSKNAPPAVETKLIQSFKLPIDATVSPPPITLLTRFFFVKSAINSAIFFDPSAKLENSNAPTAPFHKIVLDFLTLNEPYLDLHFEMDHLIGLSTD